MKLVISEILDLENDQIFWRYPILFLDWKFYLENIGTWKNWINLIEVCCYCLTLESITNYVFFWESEEITVVLVTIESIFFHYYTTQVYY